MTDQVATEKLLAGVRVVSIAVNVPGPVAAARLAGFGADVVKVEPPAGDPLALAARDYYDLLVADQDVRVLDLKSADGRRELDLLLADTDIFLTSHRTSALGRLGLGWPAVHALNPRLVQVAIVGHRAPRDDVAGHDLTYQAARGLVRPPHLPLIPVADLAGAERATSTALAALHHRDATGRGSYHQVPLEEAVEAMAAPLRHGMSAPGGPIGGGVPAYRVYAAAQGHVAVAALEQHFLLRLVEALGIDGTADELAQAFLARTAPQWEQWALERDIPLVAVRPA